nr:hypothetical protein CFP56_78122 [Quercus suber]
MIHPEGRHDGDLPSSTVAIHPGARRDSLRHDSDPSAARQRSVQRRHDGDPQCDGDPSSGGTMAILSVTATHQRQDGNDLLREAREKSSMKIGEDTSIDAVMLKVFGPRPWVRTAAMAPVRTTGAIVAATAISMAVLSYLFSSKKPNLAFLKKKKKKPRNGLIDAIGNTPLIRIIASTASLMPLVARFLGSVSF